MSDPIAVIVARLEIWVKTVLAEIKRLNEQQKELRSETIEICKEMGGKIGKLANIVKRLSIQGESQKEQVDGLAKEVADLAKRIPNEREIKVADEEKKAQKTKVSKISDKIIWLAGGGAGILFILSVLKYFKVV